MSRTDRVVDLGMKPSALTEERMNVDDLCPGSDLPANGGQGDGSGLLLVYR